MNTVLLLESAELIPQRLCQLLATPHAVRISQIPSEARTSRCVDWRSERGDGSPPDVGRKLRDALKTC
jgi:hypothetical protein